MKKILRINGAQVYPDWSYSVSQAAEIVCRTPQMLHFAINRDERDERRLIASIKTSNGRLSIKGIDLWNWAEGVRNEYRKPLIKKRKK